MTQEIFIDNSFFEEQNDINIADMLMNEELEQGVKTIGISDEKTIDEHIAEMEEAIQEAEVLNAKADRIFGYQ